MIRRVVYEIDLTVDINSFTRISHCTGIPVQWCEIRKIFWGGEEVTYEMFTPDRILF